MMLDFEGTMLKQAKKTAVVICSIVVFLSIGLLGGCRIEERRLNDAINSFLQENELGKLPDSFMTPSKVEINNQFYRVLAEHEFGDGFIHKKSIAEFIVETGCYKTAEQIMTIKAHGDNYEQELVLAFWIAVTAEALLEKTPAAEALLELFYQIIEEDSAAEWITDYFWNLPILTIHEETPEMIELFYPELMDKIKSHQTEETLVNAIANSRRLKTAIFERIPLMDNIENNIYNTCKVFPLSKYKTVLANFKALHPQKGGYILVVEDTERRLPLDNDPLPEFFVPKSPGRSCSEYTTDTLHPVFDLNNAQLIIHETYSYEGPKKYGFYIGVGLMSTSVYLRHTNIKVVDAANEKTLFNKTFKTNWTDSYQLKWGDSYFISDDYDPGEYAKQISEIVKKAL
jgi:hypothetical protein